MKCKAALGREVFETFYFPPLRLFFSFISFSLLVEKKWFENESNFSFFSFLYKCIFQFCSHSIRKFNDHGKKKFVWILSLHSTNSTVLLFSIHKSLQWYVCGEQFKKLLMYILFFFLSFP